MFIYDIQKQFDTLPSPYREQLKSIPEDILFQAFEKEIQSILDCIDVGIFIVDGKGKVLTMNQMSRQTCDISPDQIIGKTMFELVDTGVFPKDEVCTIPAIKTKKTCTVLQKNTAKKNDTLATAIPQIINNKVVRVIETERDVTKILNLEAQIKNEIELSTKYKNELEYFRNQELSVVSEIIAESPSMKKLLATGCKIAPSDATLLLQGESGVGKEVLAKFIYKNSTRKSKPFIKLNCSAIPENLLESELFGYEKGAFTGANSQGKIGFFELADEGTLLLDEIDTLPLHLQPKLLRAIQENEIIRIGGTKNIKINVRLIAATNCNLAEAVKNGRFRQDLYYRLNVIPLNIPPLRERTADIMPLANYFLHKLNKKYHTSIRLDFTCSSLLKSYPWPGNIRQLENLMERVVLSFENDIITADNLEPYLNEEMPMTHTGDSLKETVSNFEKRYIEKMIPEYSSTQELANALKIDKSTLTRKMQRYGIKNVY